MDKSYQQLTFAEKAFFHVHRAEEFQAKAEAIEALANNRAANAQLTAHLLTHDEDLAFPYRQATGTRNGHQQRAIMYGIAALLEEASD
jgi:hypothetical protein